VRTRVSYVHVGQGTARFFSNFVQAVLLVAMLFFLAAPALAVDYVVASASVPVLNTAAVNAVFGGRDGRTLKVDRCGQVRELEFVALPGTLFRVLGTVQSGRSKVYRVDTDEYPHPGNVSLYLDSRFVKPVAPGTPPRARVLPSRHVIVAELRRSVGAPYVWGGNLREGLPDLLGMYYRGVVAQGERRRLSLAGLDCSGLLYTATNGYTPRNTSELVRWGEGVRVAGLPAGRIAGLLQPLDLIVWNGHVIIVLDGQNVIESRLECNRPGHGGVVITPIRQRLAEIMRGRRPADEWRSNGRQRDIFVVRRWIDRL
jgi:cell wall-associated NlpC family hydrolase